MGGNVYPSGFPTTHLDKSGRKCIIPQFLGLSPGEVGRSNKA